MVSNMVSTVDLLSAILPPPPAPFFFLTTLDMLRTWRSRGLSRQSADPGTQMQNLAARGADVALHK